MNIAQYVKNVNKRESSLFDAHLDKVEAYQVSFSDFTDYVIHMYLKNDGAIMNPEPDVSEPFYSQLFNILFLKKHSVSKTALIART